jgi:threonine synthase
MNYFTGYQCSGCHRSYDPLTTTFRCSNCSAPLLAVYDLYRAHKEMQSFEQKGIRSMWDFREMLPVRNAKYIISFQEGQTPVYSLDTLGRSLGISKLYFKNEALNPGGSHHARQMSMLLSSLHNTAISTYYAEGIGTLGLTLSKYCAAAKKKMLLLTDEAFPLLLEAECREYGANVKRIVWNETEREKARKTAYTSPEQIFNVTEEGFTLRIEGAKTIFYELFLQFEEALPDVLILPLGDGVVILALWKALTELQKLGFIKSSQFPKVWLVQSSEYPAMSMFMKKTLQELPNTPTTIATDLYSSNTVLYSLISKILNALSVNVIHVSDEEILSSCRLLARKEGVLCSAEGGAALAALEQIVKMKQADPGQRFLVINPSDGKRRLIYQNEKTQSIN